MINEILPMSLKWQKKLFMSINNINVILIFSSSLRWYELTNSVQVIDTVIIDGLPQIQDGLKLIQMQLSQEDSEDSY